MYKDKDQLPTSKSRVLKGGRAVGRPAGASVLRRFQIPRPEAIVCIFRTTAGSGPAGDLSPGFITAHRMPRASLWSLRADRARRSRCLGLRSRPLLPARAPRIPPRYPKPELCSCVPRPTWGTELPLEIRLWRRARSLGSSPPEGLREELPLPTELCRWKPPSRFLPL